MRHLGILQLKLVTDISYVGKPILEGNSPGAQKAGKPRQWMLI
jgi:hypothetical protein